MKQKDKQELKNVVMSNALNVKKSLNGNLNSHKKEYSRTL